MNRRLARALTSLYPRRWRQRYGAEFEYLLENEPRSIRNLLNVLWSAVRERVLPTTAAPDLYPPSVLALAKLPSAFLPPAMSLIALAMLAIVAAAVGLAPEHDEGTVAHMWQLLVGAQLPLVLFFALKWVPRVPKRAICVLGIQAGALLGAMAPVFLLGL